MKKYFKLLFTFVIFFGFSMGVKAIDSGTYKIISVLDEHMALTGAEDGNIQINTFEDKSNQIWNVTAQSDGSFIIASKDNNKSLDVAGGNIANGTNIRLYSPNNTDAQKWYIRTATNG